MKALHALLALSGTALSACATTPEWTREAAQSVQPMQQIHMACMVANAAALDDGSKDPRDVVANVEGLCAPLLEPMRAYIAQEGYGETVADQYVEQVMTDNRQAAEATLVRARTQARTAP